MTRKSTLGRSSLFKAGPFQVIESLAPCCEDIPLLPTQKDLQRKFDGDNVVEFPTGRCQKPCALAATKMEPASIDAPMDPPRRRYSCENYATCLDLAAALNWDNFTCRGCSGEVDQALLWRARQALKKDEIARSVCELPTIELHSRDQEETVASRKLVS